MKSQIEKESTIELSATAEEIALIQRAALFLGMSVPDFALGCALAEAKSVLLEGVSSEMSPEDSERYARMLQELASPANVALMAAIAPQGA